MAIRRYNTMPSVATLLAVSGVVILDLAPQTSAAAAFFGKIAVVGEFEDGPFDTPTDLLSSADQSNIFGGFGYQYGSSKNQYPCALKSGGSEYWNGNGWAQTERLKFAGLCFVRVDTSVGSVTLAPLAYAQGTLKAPFALDNGVTFIFSKDGASDTTVTFAAVAAVKTGTGGTFSGVVGGETFQVSYDGGSYVTVTLQPGDTTAAAIVSRINAAFGFTFASVSSSNLRFTSPTKGTGSQVKVKGSSFTDTLGLTTSGADSTISGSGDAVNIALTTQAEFKAKVEGANAGVRVTTSSDGYPRLVSKTAVSGTIQVKTHTGATGFAVQSSATTCALPNDLVVPAGTRCSVASGAGTYIVTMQSTSLKKGATAATTFKVRPAIDDGTYAGASSAEVDTVNDQPGDLEWYVTNASALTAALTATQLDSAYLTAIASTLGPGDDTKKKINGIMSARQSDAIRAALVNNATSASAAGHFQRRAFICPANGTTAAQAIAAVASYRNELASYAAGGVLVNNQAMIDAGYADTLGNITRHPDAFLASRWSTLDPGENPGQLPEEPSLQWDTSFVTGIESVATSWDLTTYAAFKNAGICAVTYSKDLGLTFEQGITTIDPASEPSRTTIARSTLAGYIGDSLANFSIKDAKRQGTDKLVERTKIAAEGFLDTLKAPLGKVVSDYRFTPAVSGINRVRRYDVAVVPIESDDVILYALSIGAGAIQVSR